MVTPPKPTKLQIGIRMFSPLVTFIGALVIKFCFIDDPGNDPGHFIYERYISDLWLEVYMIALGFSFIEERQQTSSPFYKTLPAAFIAIAIACVILVFGLPKFKITSDLFQTWIPLGICSILFVIVSSKLSK